jgi:hypothetical protein
MRPGVLFRCMKFGNPRSVRLVTARKKSGTLLAAGTSIADNRSCHEKPDAHRADQ